MSRFSGQTSYDHRCFKKWWGYEIIWYVDRYINGSRLRWPTRFSRDTDEDGARRFCKKWDIEFPEEKKEVAHE